MPDPTDAVSLLVTDDPHEVARLASGWLTEHAVDANVLATVLAGELAGRHHYDDQSWIVARNSSGDVLGLIMHTPPHLARVPVVDPALAVAAAQTWHDAGRPLPGAGGAIEAGSAFVRRWQELTGTGVEVVRREGVYVLDRLHPPRGVPGRARLAQTADVDLVHRWYEEFGREVNDHGALVARETVEAQAAAGGYVLWEDGGVPVSLAGHRTGADVGRIGPVYTPPEHRRRGYAAAVTAATTQLVVDTGAGAMLHTDLDNPTSNGVYLRLGYRQVDEFATWRFTDVSS